MRLCLEAHGQNGRNPDVGSSWKICVKVSSIPTNRVVTRSIAIRPSPLEVAASITAGRLGCFLMWRKVSVETEDFWVPRAKEMRMCRFAECSLAALMDPGCLSCLCEGRGR